MGAMAATMTPEELTRRLEKAMEVRLLLRETTLAWRAARASIFEELRKRELGQPERGGDPGR